MPILLMLGVFYFLLVRPQQKQEQQRQESIRRLAKGDLVITSGGLIGELYAVKDHEFVVELADKVRVRVARDDVDPYEEPSKEPSKKEGEGA